MQRKEAERVRKFGHARPIVSTDHMGRKLVAVGSTIVVALLERQQ